MKTLVLELPDKADEKEVGWKIASLLFQDHILTSGQCARLLSISKRQFLEGVGSYGVSIFQNDSKEVLAVIDNALKRYGGSR